MKVQAECYSGRKAEEWPVRFRLDEHWLEVDQIIESWYGPEYVFFEVWADDGNVYILRHETSVPDGEWELVLFRDSGEHVSGQ